MTIETRPLRYVADVLVSNVDKKSVEGEHSVRLCNYTDVYYNARITADRNFMAATATAKQVARFRLRAGDSILTKDSEAAADIAVPAFVSDTLDGVVCGYHLALIRPRASVIDPAFLAWALASNFMRDQFAARASGVTRYGLTYEAIQGAQVPTTKTPEEQRRIADFLDDQVTRIDVASSERSIQASLVSERWAASLALAFSVDGRVDLVQPLKRVAWWREGPGILAQDFTEAGTPLLRIANVRGGRFSMEGCGYVSSAMARTRWGHLSVRAGELLTSGSASSGLAVEVPPEADGAIPYTGLIRIRPFSERITKDFLRFFLLSPAFVEQVNALKTGIAIQHWGPYHLAQVSVVVPSREHQESVALRLSAEQTFVESALAAIASSRSLLEERKQALITAAVTGEFDVSSAGPRAAAAVMS